MRAVGRGTETLSAAFHRNEAEGKIFCFTLTQSKGMISERAEVICVTSVSPQVPEKDNRVSEFSCAETLRKLVCSTP